MILDYSDSVWSNFDYEFAKKYFKVLAFKKPEVADFDEFDFSVKSIQMRINFLNAIVRGGDARVTNMLVEEVDPIILWLMVASQKRIVLELTRIVGEEKRMTRELLTRRIKARFEIENNELIKRSLKFLLEIGVVDKERGLKLIQVNLGSKERHNKIRYAVRFLNFEDTDVLNLLILGGI